MTDLLPSSPNTSVTPVSFAVTVGGQATLDGIELQQLARSFGTPLYVLDGATFRAMAGAYRETLKSTYPQESLVIYAGKANLSMGVCKLVAQEGLGLDVVSGGELYTALQAGFPKEKIFFNGNNKTVDELELAIHQNIGRITVDNPYELELIHAIAKTKGMKANILLRVTPGIECHTHEYIQTGHIDSKFGLDPNVFGSTLDSLVSTYKDTITLCGLHAHIGSQIFEGQPYQDLIEIMLNMFYNIRENYNLVLNDLNIGGGLGIAYTSKDDPPDVPTILKAATEKVVAYANKLNYPLPRLLVEPGRSMVATAGLTLYTVGSRKDIPNVRSYVTIDGGMGDNIRPALYGAEYSALVANKAHHPKSEVVTIAGKYCESGDILIKNIPLAPMEAGDTLAVFGTGAYNYSMASNYNRVPRPAVVLVENGQAEVLVERETYDDILRNDRVPAHLTQPATV